MTETDDSTTFVSRNLSFPEEINDMIVEMAQQHHGGNDSELIRTLVREKVNRSRFREIQTQLTELQEAIEEMDAGSNSESSNNTSNSIEHGPLKGTEDQWAFLDSQNESDKSAETKAVARVARELLDEIPDPDEEPISLAGLNSRSDHSLPVIAEALSELRERNAIEQMETVDSLLHSKKS